MKRNNKLKILYIFSATILIVLFGCSSTTDQYLIPENFYREFSETGKVEMQQEWWKSFEDRKLDSLVHLALDSNFTLIAVWERLKAAQATVDRESANLFPSLEATAGGEIVHTNDNLSDSESLNLGALAQYEIDLWGRINSRVDAETFRMKATFADYQTAAITLASQVTRTWYRLIEAEKQLELAHEQVETNERILLLLKQRFGSGLIRSVDILRQEQLLEATKEQLITAESRYQVLENQMSILLGKSPQNNWNISFNKLPGLNPLPKSGLATDLVKKRPDVKSAYYLLRAADNDLAAAISNQFPRLSISASASTAAENAGDLFDQWVASFAGNLLAPIFYGGQLSAEVNRAEAVKNQRIYEYGQTVLEAFQDVEDALIQEKKQTERIESIKRQYELALQAYEQLRVEYLNGAANYLDVLIALTEEQHLERELLAAQLIKIEYRIDLYRALAGGFETERELDEEI